MLNPPPGWPETLPVAEGVDQDASTGEQTPETLPDSKYEFVQAPQRLGDTKKHRFLIPYDIGTWVNGLRGGALTPGLTLNQSTTYDVDQTPDFWIVNLDSEVTTSAAALRVYTGPGVGGPFYRIGNTGRLRIPAQGQNFLTLQNLGVGTVYGTVIAVKGFNPEEVDLQSATNVIATNLTAALLAAFSGSGALLVSPAGQWAINNAPAAGAQATISRAAVAATRHVCTGFIIDGAAGLAAPVATILTWALRDGASGAGTILASGILTVPATIAFDMSPIIASGLNIPGSINTAMTVEWSAGLANFSETVSLFGYDAT